MLHAYSIIFYIKKMYRQNSLISIVYLIYLSNSGIYSELVNINWHKHIKGIANDYYHSCERTSEKNLPESNCKAPNDNELVSELFLSNSGGWETEEIVKPSLHGPCNIPKETFGNLSQKIFLKKYAYIGPVIILNASDNEEFQKLTVRQNLIQNFGHTTVKLSSANSYSYDKRTVSFQEYCDSYLKPQSIKALGNETFYFFGDNNNDEWFDLMNKYKYPLYSLPSHIPQYSFGVAGPGSGVPFHFHGPGFAETMWGRKRWFMYPPEVSPNFHPNKTTLQWLYEDYPNIKDDPNLYECTLNPRELIYFPDHWWHATLNIDTSVFMSTFLSP